MFLVVLYPWNFLCISCPHSGPEYVESNSSICHFTLEFVGLCVQRAAFNWMSIIAKDLNRYGLSEQIK